MPAQKHELEFILVRICKFGVGAWDWEHESGCMCVAAGLDIPSRASSGALVRLTALRHMLGQRATSSRSAAELAHFLSYGAHTSLPQPILFCWEFV